MKKLLVISEEPALAQALSDALKDCSVTSARAAEAPSKILPDVDLIVAERVGAVEGSNAENITLSDIKIPHLFITRPVRLRELLYTIEERLQAQTQPANEEIKLAGGFAFSPRKRVLISPGGSQRIALTEKESELFSILLENKEEAIQREQLLTRIWGYSEDADTHTIETHIYRLRGKLRQMEAGYDIISSPEGGYCLRISE